ncbi:MAG: DUF262 domain-containing protein [Bacteroidales bacterium]|nr:DUF262 domain-containing protein [Bacteroidales bacterium]MDD4670377.1 DUF262 domain-containing protein [Bacteroidales bacterium]
MKIELHQITIGEIVSDFRNSEEEGVIGYGGKLNIRPKYQREFVYNEKQRNAVMDTIWKGFPLNVMYWVKNEGDTFELLDGQQRTISFCSFVIGEYMMNFDDNLRGFSNLNSEQQKRILNYDLQIYICEGTPQEQLDWFRIINIAGVKLTDQELLNAVYSGSWVTSAKRKFSKTGCVAFRLGSDYMRGSPIRQDYLETVIKWINNDNVEQYMAIHQHDSNADELWLYYQNVINWVKAKFSHVRNEMKSVSWGELYNKHKDDVLDADVLEAKVSKLMRDSDVQRKAGIYPYLLDGDEHHLGIRTFDGNTKREAYERQGGHCANPNCASGHDHVFDIGEMEADHITPWRAGGKTIAANCQMLCQDCNRRKGGQ